MSRSTAAARHSASNLLVDFSLEMTGKDVPKLVEARSAIPAGTPVNVTYLAHEDLALRVAAAKAAADFGFRPVPHISARRLDSAAQLQEFLTALQAVGASEQVFVVGGDPEQPAGPYADSLEVISSGVLQEHGVRRVGISGYPDGHPHISSEHLWAALSDKAAALREAGLEGVIVTQFGFDVTPVVQFVEQVRQRGIDLPIRVGVPGPAGIKRLLSYAGRFGVSTSAGIAKKYGLSLTNLLGTAGPDNFVTELAEAYDPARHGEVKLHFYTFGGLAATARWVQDFTR